MGFPNKDMGCEGGCDWALKKESIAMLSPAKKVGP
jgi:hypothetical protein